MNETIPITIVTSCFNCEKFIEATIKSVILQNFPKIQYIIIDGASTDSTLKIVNKYRNDIDVIISEPDKGQYYGIQKGIELSKGEVMAWLNADDVYYPWTFSIVGKIFQKFPEVDWIIGLPTYINKMGQCIRVASNAGTAYPQEYIRNGWFREKFAGYLQQESMFWRKSLWDKAGGFNLKLKYAADFDLWTRFAQYAELYSVTVPLAAFRISPGEQKSSMFKDKYELEVIEVCSKFKAPPNIWQFISQRGQIWRYLLRLFIWKKCKFITYSLKDEDWVIKEKIRPLSRYSFEEALLEYRTNH